MIVDDSGGEPPPVIYYISVAYVMRGGYFPFLELMEYFVFFVIIDVINIYSIFEILFHYLYSCNEPNNFVCPFFLFYAKSKKYCKCFVFLQNFSIFASYNLKIFIN